MWGRRSASEALGVVWREFCDQDALFGGQNLPNGTGSPEAVQAVAVAREACDRALAEGVVTWSHVFLEEVLEALAETDPDRLEFELTQALGVGAQWIEALRLRRAGALPVPPDQQGVGISEVFLNSLEVQ